MSDEVIFRELPETFPKVRQVQEASCDCWRGVSRGFDFRIGSHSTADAAANLSRTTCRDARVDAGTATCAASASCVSPQGGQPVAPKPRVQKTTSPDALVMPIAIPQEVVRIVEEPFVPDTGVVGGVPGGVPGGVAGGILEASSLRIPTRTLCRLWLRRHLRPLRLRRRPRQSRFALVVLSGNRAYRRSCLRSIRNSRGRRGWQEPWC